MVSCFPLDERPLLSRLQHEVHVWLQQPDRVTDADVLAAYAASLSGEERARQQRFYFEQDRRLFLISHGMLRQLLSRYVEIAPSQWQFTSGAHGRPEIAVADGLPDLRFNISHTAGMAACVISLHSVCGVDVERVRALRNPQAIAGKLFAERERLELERHCGQDYLERFFHYWTLREAYCKATGLGISHTPKNYCFDIDAAGSVHIQFDTHAGEAAEHWQLACLQPAPGHALAVAVHNETAKPREIVCGFLAG